MNLFYEYWHVAKSTNKTTCKTEYQSSDDLSVDDNSDNFKDI